MTPGRRVVLGMLGAAIVIDIAYWSLWFADRSLLASSHRSAYYEFENAFPLADLWIGIACVGALVTLTRRTPMALFWLIAAGCCGPGPTPCPRTGPRGCAVTPSSGARADVAPWSGSSAPTAR